jgi:hypothetical protein
LRLLRPLSSARTTTRSNPHGFYKHTSIAWLGQCPFTRPGALGPSPRLRKVWLCAWSSPFLAWRVRAPDSVHPRFLMRPRLLMRLSLLPAPGPIRSFHLWKGTLARCGWTTCRSPAEQGRSTEPPVEQMSCHGWPAVRARGMRVDRPRDPRQASGRLSLETLARATGNSRVRECDTKEEKVRLFNQFTDGKDKQA